MEKKERPHLLPVGNGMVNLVEVGKLKSAKDINIEGLTDEEVRQVWDAAQKYKPAEVKP